MNGFRAFLERLAHTDENLLSIKADVIHRRLRSIVLDRREWFTLLFDLCTTFDTEHLSGACAVSGVLTKGTEKWLHLLLAGVKIFSHGAY